MMRRGVLFLAAFVHGAWAQAPTHPCAAVVGPKDTLVSVLQTLSGCPIGVLTFAAQAPMNGTHFTWTPVETAGALQMFGGPDLDQPVRILVDNKNNNKSFSPVVIGGLKAQNIWFFGDAAHAQTDLSSDTHTTHTGVSGDTQKGVLSDGQKVSDTHNDTHTGVLSEGKNGSDTRTDTPHTGVSDKSMSASDIRTRTQNTRTRTQDDGDGEWEEVEALKDLRTQGTNETKKKHTDAHMDTHTDDTQGETEGDAESGEGDEEMDTRTDTDTHTAKRGGDTDTDTHTDTHTGVRGKGEEVSKSKKGKDTHRRAHTHAHTHRRAHARAHAHGRMLSVSNDAHSHTLHTGVRARARGHAHAHAHTDAHAHTRVLDEGEVDVYTALLGSSEEEAHAKANHTVEVLKNVTKKNSANSAAPSTHTDDDDYTPAVFQATDGNIELRDVRFSGFAGYPILRVAHSNSLKINNGVFSANKAPSNATGLVAVNNGGQFFCDECTFADGKGPAITAEGPESVVGLLTTRFINNIVKQGSLLTANGSRAGFHSTSFANNTIKTQDGAVVRALNGGDVLGVRSLFKNNTGVDFKATDGSSVNLNDTVFQESKAISEGQPSVACMSDIALFKGYNIYMDQPVSPAIHMNQSAAVGFNLTCVRNPIVTQATKARLIVSEGLNATLGLQSVCAFPLTQEGGVVDLFLRSQESMLLAVENSKPLALKTPTLSTVLKSLKNSATCPSACGDTSTPPAAAASSEEEGEEEEEEEKDEKDEKGGKQKGGKQKKGEQKSDDKNNSHDSDDISSGIPQGWDPASDRPKLLSAPSTPMVGFVSPSYLASNQTVEDTQAKEQAEGDEVDDDDDDGTYELYTDADRNDNRRRGLWGLLTSMVARFGKESSPVTASNTTKVPTTVNGDPSSFETFAPWDERGNVISGNDVFDFMRHFPATAIGQNLASKDGVLAAGKSLKDQGASHTRVQSEIEALHAYKNYLSYMRSALRSPKTEVVEADKSPDEDGFVSLNVTEAALNATHDCKVGETRVVVYVLGVTPNASVEQTPQCALGADTEGALYLITSAANHSAYTIPVPTNTDEDALDISQIVDLGCLRSDAVVRIKSRAVVVDPFSGSTLEETCAVWTLDNWYDRLFANGTDVQGDADDLDLPPTTAPSDRRRLQSAENDKGWTALSYTAQSIDQSFSLDTVILGATTTAAAPAPRADDGKAKEEPSPGKPEESKKHAHARATRLSKLATMLLAVAAVVVIVVALMPRGLRARACGSCRCGGDRFQPAGGVHV